MVKTIETKSGVQILTDGLEMAHNNLFSVSSTFLQTSSGITDNENQAGQRIGDKITLSGVAFTLMLELNERYSDVTFRMFVVRSAKGDTPTTSTLWQGASGNKMLDTFNSESMCLFAILMSLLACGVLLCALVSVLFPAFIHVMKNESFRGQILL
mmetsp:Transcript_96821/g.156189  ORF Transcript_96821/g.156189 Transcript_96821/m.156189 type:complete len:155 (+) Transcript_96821:514-978(+)